MGASFKLTSERAADWRNGDSHKNAGWWRAQAHLVNANNGNAVARLGGVHEVVLQDNLSTAGQLSRRCRLWQLLHSQVLQAHTTAHSVLCLRALLPLGRGCQDVENGVDQCTIAYPLPGLLHGLSL